MLHAPAIPVRSNYRREAGMACFDQTGGETIAARRSVERMDPGWWRVALALVPAVAWVVVCGVDLAHSDLSVQRTLVLVRRDHHAFPGDLIADHAGAHPGLWLDLLALLPQDDLTSSAITLLLFFAIISMAAAYLRRLRTAALPMAIGVLAAVIARDLPGYVDTLPSAPISRAAVLPPVFAAWALARSRYDHWTGILGGIAIAIHPAIGASGSLMAAAMARHPLRLLGLAAAVAAPVVAPALWASTAFSPLQSAVVAWRWGHHLDLEHSLALGIFALVWSSAIAVCAPPQRRRPARAAVGILTLASGAAVGICGGLLPVDWSRLHPLHAAVPVIFWVFFDVARTLLAQPMYRRLPLALMLLTLGARSVDGWRPTPRPLPAEVVDWLSTLPQDRLVGVDPGQASWARLQSGRGVYLSVKDGGEVIADARFARRWARRFRSRCGTDIPPIHWLGGPGWVRVRDACQPPTPDPDAFVADGLGVLQVPADTELPGWTSLASRDGWQWVIPRTP